jgi:hypothetical protein
VISTDEVISSGYDEKQAQAAVDCFRDFLDQHKEVPAFADKGGAVKAAALFADRLDAILDDLSGALVA